MVFGPSAGKTTRLVKAGWPVSYQALMSTEPSNCAVREEAEPQELANAGMSAHARCESVSNSVSLGFCMAIVDDR